MLWLRARVGAGIGVEAGGCIIAFRRSCLEPPSLKVRERLSAKLALCAAAQAPALNRAWVVLDSNMCVRGFRASTQPGLGCIRFREGRESCRMSQSAEWHVMMVEVRPKG